jgi:hypothetical protein
MFGHLGRRNDALARKSSLTPKTDAGASAILAKRLTKAKQQSSYPGEMYQIIPTALIDETIAALDSFRSTDSAVMERLAAKVGKLTIEKLSHAVELRAKFAPLLDKAVGYSIAFTAKEVEKALAELQPSTTPPTSKAREEGA